MSKIMIASDIHGSAYYCRLMLDRFKEENAERLVLLGDILYHGPRNDLPKEYAPKEVIAMLNPLRNKIICVRGNCDTEVDQMVLDFNVLCEQAYVNFNGRSIVLAHGHKLDEKNIPALNDGDILLCGHTHVPKCEKRDGYIYMNPGSVSIPKENSAGSYGVDKSIEALENLYGINIDYYVKINFAGSQAVIDALGGITIESEIEFTNGWEAAPVSYHFVQGANECDGEKAIAFARERKAFAAGDFQRGRNQTAVIKGIIQKATSPAILTRYSAVMDTVSDMFLTNIPSSAISDLVKLQLSNSTPWNIQTYSISGKTDEYRHLEVSNVYGASIVLPYEEDISTATKLMNKVIAGETFDVDTYLNSDN